MMFDLGLSYRYFQNYTAVKNYINFLKSEDSYLDELREKHMAELAPEIGEQTRIDDETNWDVAKDLGYRISSKKGPPRPRIRALQLGHNIKQAERPSRIPWIID